MEIQFKTELQKHIADLMWEAEDIDKVNEIMKVYGREGRVVYDMIMAEYFDDVEDVELAEDALKKFTLGTK